MLRKNYALVFSHRAKYDTLAIEKIQLHVKFVRFYFVYMSRQLVML